MRAVVAAAISGLAVAVPAAGDDAAARAEAAVARRDFAAAVATLEAAPVPARAAAAAERRGRIEDLRAAAEGLRLVREAVAAHRDRFRAVAWDGAPPVDVVGADAEGLTTAVRGGSARLPWARLPAPAFAVLVERARPAAAELPAAAALLHAVGDDDGAERRLVALIEGGGDAAVASALWARWCGEREVPAGGYVVHGGRLVTVEDRDRLALEARLAALSERVRSGDGPARRAAADELLDLGDPGRWTLLKALQSRRNAAARELAALRTWTQPAVRARLRQELDARRAAALRFIEDPAAYPYPSAEKRGQAEVDRLVAAVRQVWTDPVEVVRAWDPAVEAALAAVAEADALLARVVEDYVPDVAAVRGPVNAMLDVPGSAADPHDAKVLAYNLAVRTSADREERDNVLAVNEYRAMMGRGALRIDERLLRAARAHSRHMRLHGYFAHESPEPGLETPAKRAARKGYAGGVGENISQGRATGRGAFEAWFGSAGHHRNMLGPRWTEMGCGRSGDHFTQLFGGAGGKSLTEPDPLPPPGEDCAPEPLPDPAATDAGPASPGGPFQPPR